MEKIQLKRRQVTRCSPQSQLLEGKQQNEMGSNKAPVISLTERCTYAGAGVDCSPREDSKGVQRGPSAFVCSLPPPWVSALPLLMDPLLSQSHTTWLRES